MRNLLVLWFGQTVSILGSTMANFALSIWIFDQTGSATSLTLVLLANISASVIVGLYVGVIVDRFRRKHIMIAADIVSALTAIALLLLISYDLQVWHIYVLTVIQSPFSLLQLVAYEASMTMMVDRKDYVRAGSLGSLTRYSVAIVGPALAAPLYLTIGLGGIIVIDLATFLIAVIPLLLIPIPDPPHASTQRSGLQQIRDGFAYMRQRPILMWLLAIHASFEFFQIMGQGVKTPMILARTGNDAAVLAAVSVASGVGGILAALLMSSWGGGRIKRLHLYFYGTIGGAIGKVLHGFSQVPAAWIGTQLFTSTNFPVQEGAYKALWMEQVDPAMQGRLFALNTFAMRLISIPSLAIAGPLADIVFEPGMQPDGALAEAFGWLVGTGTGAGFSLLFALNGALMLVIALVGFWKLDVQWSGRPRSASTD
jgi:hypothetical protein